MLESATGGSLSSSNKLVKVAKNFYKFIKGGTKATIKSVAKNQATTVINALTVYDGTRNGLKGIHLSSSLFILGETRSIIIF